MSRVCTTIEVCYHKQFAPTPHACGHSVPQASSHRGRCVASHHVQRPVWRCCVRGAGGAAQGAQPSQYCGGGALKGTRAIGRHGTHSHTQTRHCAARKEGVYQNWTVHLVKCLCARSGLHCAARWAAGKRGTGRRSDQKVRSNAVGAAWLVAGRQPLPGDTSQFGGLWAAACPWRRSINRARALPPGQQSAGGAGCAAAAAAAWREGN